MCYYVSPTIIFSSLDALSTFAIVRKIFNKFGSSGAFGKRSKAAIKKSEAAELKKMEKQQEAIAQLETNIHLANKNLTVAKAKGATTREVRKIEDKLKGLIEQKVKQQKVAVEAGENK